MQAILINPKWRPCDEFLKIVKLINPDSASDGSLGALVNSNKARDRNALEDEDSDQEELKASARKAFKGISMVEFSQLIIPKSVMSDGILFIWVEKEYIMEVVTFLEAQEFYYVENMCWVMLDETMKEGKSQTQSQLLTLFRGGEDSDSRLDSRLRERVVFLPEEV